MVTLAVSVITLIMQMISSKQLYKVSYKYSTQCCSGGCCINDLESGYLMHYDIANCSIAVLNNNRF